MVGRRKSLRHRILAIDALSSGFGFVVIENPTRLVDWGVRTSKPYSLAICAERIADLIVQYQPSVLVIEDCRKRRRPRSIRVQTLLQHAVSIAESKKVNVRSVSWQRVNEVFEKSRRTNKFRISGVVARVLPEIAHLRPPYRKPWMCEHHHTPIFDASALALTYFCSLPSMANLKADIQNEHRHKTNDE